MYENQSFYKEIIDNLYDGVYFVDRDRIITYWNKGAERITGYTGTQVMGHGCQNNILNHVTEDGLPLCNAGCPLIACMSDGHVREAEVFLHHAHGHRVPVLVRAAPLRNAAGDITGAVETFSRDTAVRTVRRELRDLRHTVQTDPLTGMRNRQYLEGRLCGAIAEQSHHLHTNKMQDHTKVGLLFIDIDNFKTINDTYGHDIGDHILQMVSSTLRQNLRSIDVVGRWGGEEFVVLLYDMPSIAVVKSMANKLRRLVESSHFDSEMHRIEATISVGATLLLPDDSRESIIRRADTLMYQSKNKGRNRVTVG